MTHKTFQRVPLPHAGNKETDFEKTLIRQLDQAFIDIAFSFNNEAVFGHSLATPGNLAVFADATGRAIQDGGPPGGITGAPTNAQYVVVALNGSLTAERRLQVSGALSLTDGGANGDITVGRAALTGDVTAAADNNATTIANNTVSYAKMQDVSATSRVLGRITAGAGDPEELTGTDVRTIAGLATTDTPQFTGIEVGHASDTTLARASAGDVQVEGNRIFRVGGTDVPVADGGTNASSAEDALSFANLGAYRVLAADNTSHSVTGTTTETTLATITVPANSMGANGRIRISVMFSFPNNANNKIMRIRWGGSTGNIILQNTQTTNLTLWALRELMNRNATNSQLGHVFNNLGLGASSGSFFTDTLDTTANQDLVITGELGNSADTLKLESYVVEILKKA